MKTYKLFCISCGEPFTATRSDARTHTHKCRTELGRMVKMGAAFAEEQVDEAEEIITDLKEKITRLEAISKSRRLVNKIVSQSEEDGSSEAGIDKMEDKR